MSAREAGSTSGAPELAPADLERLRHVDAEIWDDLATALTAAKEDHHNAELDELDCTLLLDLVRLYRQGAGFSAKGTSGAPETAPAKSWRPVETAPRDGSLLRLLVRFTENSLDDDNEPQATIGMNNFANTEIDEWQFAGWCWTHDRFTQGDGEVLGWMPFAGASGAAEPLTDALRRAVEAIDLLIQWDDCGLAPVEHLMERCRKAADEGRAILAAPKQDRAAPSSGNQAETTDG